MEIDPIKHLNSMVKIPGSKSYTQRALIIGALADGKSFLQNALLAEDTEYLIDALRSLGSEILIEGDNIVIGGTGGNIINPPGEIYLGNNGTAMRLLTGLVSLGRGTFTLTGNGRLCERPVKPLLDALRILGADARSKNEEGYPPVVVHANGLRGGRVALADIDSSQYVSSLLICAPFAVEDTVIELQGHIPSLPYIHMTIEVMKNFGVEVIRETANRYAVKCGQRYGGKRYRIEGDASSASYFFLASAMCGGRVRVGNINPKTLQGDIKLLPIMERLGCTVVGGDHWVEVVGGELPPGEYIFDMGDMPDMVPTLSVLAAIRPGQTIIKNVSHLRKKESNRLEALVNELRKTGVRAEETADGILINGGKPHGAEIETYNDHRIAMSFAILGLRIPDIRIKDKNCVNKSFPGFWGELEKLS
ncbi:MAG: 3-phosphoshikimate 1-carboxyvinyltransferase [Proteobacteria bacterium]|nr:3-phosphoshikimate 1-carboxyvinyltransferase [Pseudomonadota bacterium]